MLRITERTRAAAVALLLGLALAVVFAGVARAATNVPAGYAGQEWRADQPRSLGLNQRYHLGPYRTDVAQKGWLGAVQIRSDALNRKYRLGRYAATPSVSSSPRSGFDWGDAGIGAAAMLGLALVVGAITAGARRYRNLRQSAVV